MLYHNILFTMEAGVARLTLNRPHKLNSFTEDMHIEVRDALDHVRAAEPRVLVITGAGRAFCAGQDLNDRAVEPGKEPDLGESIEKFYAPLVRQVRDLPLPVVCAVNGIAAGAGCNFALACDLVIAAHSAEFYQPFCKLGLVPDTGGTFFLPRLVGRARALGLALLGDKLPAREAAEWGLIWQAVPDAQFTATVEKLVERLAAAPTLGLARIKQAMNFSFENTLDYQLNLERDFQRGLGRSRDYREGVEAFLAKRPPHFVGN